MLDKNLDAQALYNIAVEEDLTPSLGEALKTHKACYRALKLWVDLELETKQGSLPPIPPVVFDVQTVEDVKKSEPVRLKTRTGGASFPGRKSFNYRKIALILAGVFFLILAALYLFTIFMANDDDSAGDLEKGKVNSVSSKVDEGKDLNKYLSASGDAFTCVAEGKNVSCVGLNSHGQLGTGAASNINQHSFTLPQKVRKLVAGKDHVCALLDQGVSCWGDNRWHQVSDQETLIMPPIQIPLFTGKKADDIEAGDIHTCIAAQGKIYCFGSDFAGQFGSGVQGAKAGVLTEIVLPEKQKAVKIFAQSFSTCVSTDRGRFYCFGSNMDKRIVQNDNLFVSLTEIKNFLPKGE